MPQLTLNLPDALMPYVNRKASEGYETPENYVIALLEMNQWQDDHPDFLAGVDQGALEDILEERDKGPFIEIKDTKALKERVMAKALARIHTSASHG